MLVDNHLILNPVFTVVEPDGKTPLPSKIWDNAWKIRHIVLDTIKGMAKPNSNFIFTNSLVDSSPDDQKLFDEIAELAKARGATLLPVRLLVSVETLCERVKSPERTERFKMTDPISTREIASAYTLLKPKGCFDLEITTLKPSESAMLIVQEAGRRVGV